jgi:hypothetical protein
MFDLTALLAAFGGRSVVLRRPLFEIAGGVNEALILGQSMFWQESTGPDEWWFKTREDWEEETCLSAYQQRAALERLEHQGFIEVELRRGLPAKNYYRVRIEAIAEALAANAKAKRLSSKNLTTGDQAAKPPVVEKLNGYICREEVVDEGVEEQSLFEACGVHLDPPPPLPTKRCRKREDQPGDEGFDRWYQAMPKRVQKEAARKAYVKASASLLKRFGGDPGKVDAFLVQSAQSYAERCAKNQTEPRFMLHPSTWLNSGSYDDEEAVVRQVPFSQRGANRQAPNGG